MCSEYVVKWKVNLNLKKFNKLVKVYKSLILFILNMSTFVVYQLTSYDGCYIGRSKQFDRRIEEHRKVRGEFEHCILGEYENISVNGYGRLEPRLEFYWFKKKNPNLNKVTPGVNYYNRDLRKYDEPLEEYEKLEKLYRV